jgi:hypothetical protein
LAGRFGDGIRTSANGCSRNSGFMRAIAATGKSATRIQAIRFCPVTFGEFAEVVDDLGGGVRVVGGG